MGKLNNLLSQMMILTKMEKRA